MNVTQSPPARNMSLPITIETDGPPVRAVLEMIPDKERYEIYVEANPKSVTIDPDFHALRNLATSELPATLRDAMRAKSMAVFASGSGDVAVDFLVKELFSKAEEVSQAAMTADTPDADAIAVIGDLREVLANRRRFFDHPLPAQVARGQIRVWVEKDALDRLWLFVAADAPERIEDDLANIRFYGRQSWLIIAPQTPPQSGRWSPVSPRIKLTTD